MTPKIQVEVCDNVLVVTITNPPVNALGLQVRRELTAALQQANDDVNVQAVVLHGSGGRFSAGADIGEFGAVREQPWMGGICERIAASAKPIVAAMDGVALGGGLELALAAHYRIAASDTRMGLPEVQLGLIPGAGGTQRLPRLVGAATALDLMLTGRHIKPDEAMHIGLIDRIANEGDLRSQAVAWAKTLVAGDTSLRSGAGRLTDTVASLAEVETARLNVAKKVRGLIAPGMIVDAVRAAIEVPLNQGLSIERECFLECVNGPQRSGLTHAFFAERQVRRIPEARTGSPRRLDNVGVIGGGTMGSGIAVALLDAGLHVTMVERDAESLLRGRKNVEKVYDRLIGSGRMDAEAKKLLLERFSGATGYDALASADLVIEAVFEDMAIKKLVFTELDRLCKPGAVLATNTSFLDIDEIAGYISRPEDVIGLHFFSPANIMKLLEIIVPRQVSPDVVATGFALADLLRKVSVRAGVCDGFIGNRILYVYREAIGFMLEEGASPYQIDRALENFGFSMGPYRTMDLTGGDISWAARKRKAATRDPQARYVRIPDLLCERGWFGQKTGQGYYSYPDGARVGQPDPKVLALIDEERKARGIQARDFSDEEIVRRYMCALVNEAANVLEEGIALRPLDVDVTLVNGYGFPRWRGGPMHYADSVGLDVLLRDIQAFAKEDPRFWEPAPVLVDLVKKGCNFATLNHSFQ